MLTVRENVKSLVKRLVVEKEIPLRGERVDRLADEIIDRLGLNGPEGNYVGYWPCAVVVESKGMTTIFSKPMEFPVIWIQADRLLKDGIDAVEVY
jgi:hypothetical protein